jgi:hypothetical protein
VNPAVDHDGDCLICGTHLTDDELNERVRHECPLGFSPPDPPPADYHKVPAAESDEDEDEDDRRRHRMHSYGWPGGV